MPNKHFLKIFARSVFFLLHVLNKNKFRKVNPFHKECIITEDKSLPEISRVTDSPIPRTNNGGISLKLRWAKANTKEDIIIPK